MRSDFLHNLTYAMKYFILILFVLFSSLTSIASRPKLWFSYSEINDFICQKQTGFTIPDAWTFEVEERIPEFQTTWDKAAPKLFETLYSMLGRGYSHVEMRVTLSACKTLSMSNPYIVNVRRYLNSYNKDKDPIPLYALNNVVFHEFLHNYLDEIFNEGNSKMLSKYKSEPVRVKSHLHLMALQRAIYTELKLKDLLKWIDYNYKRMGGAYARSWVIVSEIEGHNVFVNDLKSNLR